MTYLNSPWYQYIVLRENTIDLNEKEVYFLHFTCDETLDYDLWFESVNPFINALDGFMVSNSQGVFILNEALNMDDPDFYETIELFNNDFMAHIQFYVGFMHQVNENLSSRFEEERILLTKYPNQKLISYLSTLYVENELPKIGMYSNLFKSLKESLLVDSELKDMIQMLWKTSGNISQTANELFIHRNTLIYRMDKVEKTTNLNLKLASDLLIAYLLTL